MITTGKANSSGAKFNTVATAKAEKPTCESPSPIIALRLKTSAVPINAAEIEINSPAKNPLTKKPCSNISNIMNPLNIFFSLSEKVLLP